MEYFLLKQDERYNDFPMIIDLFSKVDKRNINIENYKKLDDMMVFHVNASENSVFMDILERQIYLISSGLKDLISKYEPNIIYKTVFLIDRVNKVQRKYFLPIFFEVDTLHESSEFNLDKSVIKKIVLDKNKIKDRKIFKINKGEKTQIVVSLDLAESILRRSFIGVKLEDVKVK
ncbi:imm11 family protein [Tepidibacter sp. Z1-5]|uniref:imm11 family protein n=1 Tax=Tepidibacter sp. Z1-5 TaxID=3134138 RepID=UPI0030BBC67A